MSTLCDPSKTPPETTLPQQLSAEIYIRKHGERQCRPKGLVLNLWPAGYREPRVAIEKAISISPKFHYHNAMKATKNAAPFLFFNLNKQHYIANAT